LSGAAPVPYLSPAWHEAAAEVLGALHGPGPSVRVQWTVSKAPGGEATWTWRVEDGRVAEVAIGPDGDAELVLTMVHPDHLELTQGAVSPAAAFMQGRLKAAGHTGRLLELLRWTSQPAVRDALAELGRRTAPPDA